MSDKKPWEEEWRYADVHVLMGGPVRVVEARERMAAAAPDMARAILGLGEVRDGQWHTRECWAAKRGCIVECQPLGLALAKAGVIP